MRLQKLKQAWEIYIFPFIIYYAYSTIISIFFVTLKEKFNSNDNIVDIIEKMLTYTLCGPTFSLLYYVIYKFEKVKQVQLSKFIKRCMQILVFFYILFTIFFLIDLYKFAQSPSLT